MAIFILNVLNQASYFKCIRLPDDAHREISSIEISNMITKYTENKLAVQNPT